MHSVKPELSKSLIIYTYVEVNVPGFANFIDELSQCDFCLTNFGVILEYLESSIRLSSTWSWHVFVVVQFYPWFKFQFLLFQTHYHILPLPKTNKNKI